MRRLLSKSNLIILAFMLSSLYIGSLFSASANESKVKSKVEINIGIYAPFSNEHAFIGRTMLGTLEKARDQLNSPEINYTFYPLDQLPDNAHAAITLQKFIKAHQIKILLTQGASNGIVAASIAKNNKIIHFSLANNMSIADGKNNFLAWSPEYEQAVALVDELKQKKGDRGTMTLTLIHARF